MTKLADSVVNEEVFLTQVRTDPVDMTSKSAYKDT